jgi:hypothetical protein
MIAFVLPPIFGALQRFNDEPGRGENKIMIADS